MKVILLKEVPGRGGEGDVIEVKRGFANNYLLTEGFAVKATPGNLKQLEQRRHNIEKREEVRVADAEALAEKLSGSKVKIEAQVGEEGQLFGSVTATMIADAIKDQLDIEVDRKRVELGKPIKRVGDYDVSISIYRNIKATVNVNVFGTAPEGEDERANYEVEANDVPETEGEKAEKAATEAAAIVEAADSEKAEAEAKAEEAKAVEGIAAEAADIAEEDIKSGKPVESAEAAIEAEGKKDAEAEAAEVAEDFAEAMEQAEEANE